MPIAIALLAGIVFGAGLAIADMVNPARVLNFLDVAGNWDPSLAFVMAGGLAITAIGYRLIFRRPSPPRPSPGEPGDVAAENPGVHRCDGGGHVGNANVAGQRRVN